MNFPMWMLSATSALFPQVVPLLSLSDIADIKDSHKKAESFSRLAGKNVVTLNVIKKSGTNLINAADQIKVITDDMKANDLPKDLKYYRFR